IERSGGREHANGAGDESAGQRRGGCAGGTCARTHGLAGAPLEEPDVERVFIDFPDEGDVGPIGKLPVPFDGCAEGSPVEIEMIDKDGALRISDVEDGRIMIEDGCAQFLDMRGAHVHLEREAVAGAFAQAELFQSSAGKDAHFLSNWIPLY